MSFSSRNRCALRMQLASVSASSRQGITIESSTGSVDAGTDVIAHGVLPASIAIITLERTRRTNCAAAVGIPAKQLSHHGAKSDQQACFRGRLDRKSKRLNSSH